MVFACKKSLDNDKFIKDFGPATLHADQLLFNCKTLLSHNSFIPHMSILFPESLLSSLSLCTLFDRHLEKVKTSLFLSLLWRNNFFLEGYLFDTIQNSRVGYYHKTDVKWQMVQHTKIIAENKNKILALYLRHSEQGYVFSLRLRVFIKFYCCERS